MKYPSLLMLSLLSLVSAFGSETHDPFAAKGGAEWQLEAIEEKPYLLEIAYGEYEASQGQAALPLLEKWPDPDFLSSSTRLSLATSSNEKGEFKEIGRHSVKYQLSENDDGSLKLKIYIDILEKPGNRTTNTEITIADSDWYFISGSTRKENDGPTRVFKTAIRVTPQAILSSQGH